LLIELGECELPITDGLRSGIGSCDRKISSARSALGCVGVTLEGRHLRG
jgi:hypothetical protein